MNRSQTAMSGWGVMLTIHLRFPFESLAVLHPPGGLDCDLCLPGVTFCGRETRQEVALIFGSGFCCTGPSQTGQRSPVFQAYFGSHFTRQILLHSYVTSPAFLSAVWLVAFACWGSTFTLCSLASAPPTTCLFPCSAVGWALLMLRWWTGAAASFAVITTGTLPGGTRGSSPMLTVRFV